MLGVPNQEEPFPPLRDGDIVHYTTSGAWLAGAVSRTGLLLFFARWPCSAALFLTWLVLSYPAPTHAAPTDPQHGLWSPYQGRLGPAAVAPDLSVEWQLLQLEPIWKHGFVRTSTCLDRGDTHWVPVLPSSDLVTVLVLGSPRPLALILPVVVSRSFLLRVLGRLFDQVRTIAGRHVLLSASAPAGAEFTLCTGDVLDARACEWVPALMPARSQHFASITDARDFGFWSHPLTFEGVGSALLWSSTTTTITLLPLRGRQWWDPDAGTLHPAFHHILDSWWPDPTQPRGYGEIIFFIPRDAAAGRDGTPGPPPVPLTTSGQPYVSCSSAASSHSRRSTASSGGCLVWVFLSFAFRIGDTDSHGRGATSLAWACLWCYLAAFGAPLSWYRHSGDLWEASAADACRLQAALRSCWWGQPLPTQLPGTFPATYHCAWQRYPVWGSGVPDELFIATDGSGVGTGASAFVAWAFRRTGWYRVGWFAAALPHIPWAQLPLVPDSGRLSFHSELVALQSAGLWAAALIDHWALHTGSQPKRITIAVDNSAALQVAAGHANPLDPVASWCRSCWQAVQARCSTTFRHVHGHQGIFVNTIVDALAGAATAGLSSRRGSWPDLQAAVSQIANDGPWLWMLPQARIRRGMPVFQMHVVSPQTSSDTPVVDEPSACVPLDSLPSQPPLSLQIVTANVQSLKDARTTPFNPSGHAARRQYLYQQFHACRIDIACIQEARSRTGRWATAGVLTWRSGSQQGQYTDVKSGLGQGSSPRRSS